MNVLITGGSGLLGSYLLKHSSFSNAIGTSHSKTHNKKLHSIDLTSKQQTDEFLDSLKPNHIIHTVALTDVDKCESHVHEAYRINVGITENIVAWINNKSPHSRLTYISTDHIYEHGHNLHSEMDISPTNVYGLTKLLAEKTALQVRNSVILRVNFFGHGLNIKNTLSDWIIKSLQENKAIELFDDVFFTPLFIEHTADAIADCTAQSLQGIYNLGASGGGMSKAEFGALIAKTLDLSLKNVTITSVANSHLKVYRPKNMAMDVSKIEAALGYKMPTIADGINLMCEKIMGGLYEQYI